MRHKIRSAYSYIIRLSVDLAGCIKIFLFTVLTLVKATVIHVSGYPATCTQLGGIKGCDACSTVWNAPSISKIRVSLGGTWECSCLPENSQVDPITLGSRARARTRTSHVVTINMSKCVHWIFLQNGIYIRESVDSLCRDGTNMLISLNIIIEVAQMWYISIYSFQPFIHGLSECLPVTLHDYNLSWYLTVL